MTINSYSDYERIFGGLWTRSTMSYAVKDFYQNGGSTAVIIRIEKGASASHINLSSTTPNEPVLTLEAASKGSWGGSLKVFVNYQTKDTSPDSKQFNLIVTENVDGGKTETFLNVSVDKNDPRFLTRILEQGSMLYA